MTEVISLVYDKRRSQQEKSFILIPYISVAFSENLIFCVLDFMVLLKVTTFMATIAKRHTYLTIINFGESFSTFDIINKFGI